MTESTFLEAIHQGLEMKYDQMGGYTVLNEKAVASACLKIARQGQVDALQEMKYSKEELDASGYHEEHYYKKTNAKLETKISQIKALMNKNI